MGEDLVEDLKAVERERGEGGEGGRSGSPKSGRTMKTDPESGKVLLNDDIENIATDEEADAAKSLVKAKEAIEDGTDPLEEMHWLLRMFAPSQQQMDLQRESESKKAMASGWRVVMSDDESEA